MLRCVTLGATVAALLAVLLPAAAQTQRNFPADAMRGTLAVDQPPDVLLNGRATRLAPGARIRDQNNMMLLSGALAGQKMTVHYTREPTTGLLLNVWLLTAAEAARRPWPANDEQLKTWTFDPAGQTWSRP